MKSCYICGNTISTKHKSHVKCVCGATYRVLRNVKIINPKIKSIPVINKTNKRKGVAWTVKGFKYGPRIVVRDENGNTFDYSPAHFAKVWETKNPIATLGLGIAGGVGFGAGYIAAEKIFKKKEK